MYGLNADGQRQFDAGVSCAVIAGVAVVLRIFSKLWHKNGCHADDYWIIVALLFCWVNVSLMQWGSITGGGGIEMTELYKLAAHDPSKLNLVSNYLKAVFISFLIYISSMLAIKLSILFFYRRIFSIKEQYNAISIGIIILSVAWYVATEVATILCDIPMEGFWNPQRRKRNVNFGVIFLVTGILETIIDFLILILPVRVAFALHLPMRTRVAVAALFALGGFTVVTNIIRIQYVYRPDSRYVSLSKAELWSNIHQMTAIVCACLPIYKKLWSTLSQTTSNIIIRYATSLRSLIRRGSKESKNTSYVQLGILDNPSGSIRSDNQRAGLVLDFQRAVQDKGHSTISVSGGGNNHGFERLQLPANVISRERSIDVV